MASSKLSAKSPTIRRILREAQELAAAPSADLAAAPLENDLFEWHFTLRGPPGTVYADGIYHGRIVLPPTYPLRPPSFRFVTPSGRFEANREICLSISGHHEETWQPAWGLRTALVALRAFMETDPKGQVGGLDASDDVRRRLAAESHAFVCTACGGRSNTDILAASAADEVTRQELDDGGSGGGEQDTNSTDKVPLELKLVFRDELEPGVSDGRPNETAAAAPEPVAPSAPAPVLASASISEATRTSATERAHNATPAPVLHPPAPAHAVPIPTPAIPLSNAVSAQTLAQTQPPPMPRRRIPTRHMDDAVPLWVDRTIVVLCVVLGAMLMRIVFG